jgi:hypothetical protein
MKISYGSTVIHEERFELNNQPEPPPRWQGEAPAPKCRQKVLFSGMDCLPGQMDLFPTDGEEVTE